MPPSRPESSPTIRVIIPVLLTLVIAFCVWLMFRTPESAVETKRPVDPTAAESTVRYGAAPVTKRRDWPTPKPESVEEKQDQPPPVIDEIIVEKQEVCSGEENLITVRAHTVNSTDEFLHYRIGSYTGQQVPVRLRLDDEGKPQERTISVFGKNNVVTTVPIPPFKVKDCKPYRMVFIMHRLQPNTEGEYEFFARITDIGAKEDPDPKPFKPKAFVWDFGDGKTVTSTGPEVVHD